MNKEQEINVRFCPPSRFDIAKIGTVVKVYNEKSYEYFIQISEYDGLPNWKKWGDFLGVILKEKAIDEVFVKRCMKLFDSTPPKNAKILEDGNYLNVSERIIKSLNI